MWAVHVKLCMPAQAPVMAAPSSCGSELEAGNFPSLYEFTYVPGKMLEKANKYITATVAWNICLWAVNVTIIARAW